MPITMREVEGEQIADLVSVLSWVYSGQPPTPDWMKPRVDSRDFVAYVDGKPASACRVHGYRLARGDSDILCGGVASVGTLAEHRQSGVGSELMKGILRDMREQGQVMAALYAYKEAYYRRLGYEVCGWRWQIRCPQARLPKLKCTLPVRRIDAADVQVLDEAYVPFIRRMSGANLRTPYQWQIRMGSRAPMIYAVGDPIEAYAWVSLDGFWKDIQVGEMAWTSKESYESILAVLAGLCSNQEALVWSEPPLSPFMSRFIDHDVKAEMSRPSMFRVTDVAGALQCLKPMGDGEFSIEVHDDILSENNGIWRVRYSEDEVEVVKGKTADLRIDVRHLAQIVMGAPCVSDLYENELIEVLDVGGLIGLTDLCPSTQVVCMEFF